MKALLALVPVTIFALANCGVDTTPPSSSGDDPSTQSGESRSCRPTCNTAADCATPGQPLQDAAHYACNEKRCEWLGCQSETDCTSSLMSTKLTCAATPDAEAPSCVPTCQAPADCAIPGFPLGDAAHFACTAGKCEWQGCKSTSECTTSLGNSRFVCEKAPGALTASCLPTCNTAADCAVPGSKLGSADHYACKSGKCEWLGCKTTSECSTDLHISNVICE